MGITPAGEPTMSNNGHDTQPTDATEPLRRAMIAEQQAIGPLSREQLAAVHGDVYDTAEMTTKFRVKSFMAPFVVVERLLDNKLGTLEFQHSPRFYYGFTPDK
jgi:hypothetical protein